MSKEDGGQAFPSKDSFEDEHQYVNSGMSLRDWFAGQALNALIASCDENKYEVFSRQAYKYADAMLEAQK